MAPEARAGSPLTEERRRVDRDGEGPELPLQSGIGRGVSLLHRAGRECLRCHESVPKPPPIGQPWHDASVMGAHGLYQSMSDVERYQVLEYVKAVNRRYFSMDVGLKHSVQEGAAR